MNSSVGQKIKFFRERADLGQYYLEEMIGMAHGSLSRIEKGKTNPTKETILKIAKYLDLSSMELMYLNGSFDSELKLKEIVQAKNEVRYVLGDEKSFAYLIDEKRRIWAVSKGLVELSNLTEKKVESFIGKNILELICLQSKSSENFLFVKDLEQMLLIQLSRLVYEVPYVFFDPYWLKLIEKLLKYPIFRNAWNLINSKNYQIDIFTADSRIVKFDFNGFDINLVYSEESLQKNQRFKLSVYFSSNNLLDFLKKFSEK